MRIVALVGASGTGKSHKAIEIAHENDIECIIDDGLLIKENKVLAGKSAKREKTALAAVKRALFFDESHRKEVIEKIRHINPQSLLIIGTSEKMVHQISKALEVGPVNEIIYIKDVSTEEEIKRAKYFRNIQGKHVIPVPTFEIKKDFSGYFLNPLKIFKRNKKSDDYYVMEKSVVRPTFSYLGKYYISDKVIFQLVKYSTNGIQGLQRIKDISLRSFENGVILNLEVMLDLGVKIPEVCEIIQKRVKREVEMMTSLNIISVNIEVTNVKIN